MCANAGDRAGTNTGQPPKSKSNSLILVPEPVLLVLLLLLLLVLVLLEELFIDRIAIPIASGWVNLSV